MIIVDTALEKLERENRPIRVGMIGAGFMGRGVAFQILKAVQGMKLVAIANRNPEKALTAYREAGVTEVNLIDTPKQLDASIEKGNYAVTENAELLCGSEQIDVVLEVTGAIEFGAKIALTAIRNGKHLVLMNAELDGTVGPILKTHADRAGVIYTNVDGDQPGVTMNLFRFVKHIGCKPILAGNIKGLHDPYRNPSTQREFAEKWKQKPTMVTSFADGSKIAFEQAIIANATGMRVAKRGMFGPTVPVGTPIGEAAQWFPLDQVGDDGIVDYVVGASPGPGVFVIGSNPHPLQQHYLELYKLGKGPFYCFYTPYHLCHFEVPNTIARAEIFRDPAITPQGAPNVGVITAAKTQLRGEQVLDGIGGYMVYGLCENWEVICEQNLLPLGLAEGCRLKQDISKDHVLTFDDVILPENRIADQLYQEQQAFFS